MRKITKSIIILSIFHLPFFANTIDKSVDVINKTNNQLKSLQNKIDENEENRDGLLHEYRFTNSNIRKTKIYNEQLEKIIKSQKDEVASLDKQMIEIEETQKNIFPLMIDMVKSLRNLVEKDTPFLLEERLQRVSKLEKTLNRSDIKTHDKYRIILEAFKIEYDYAKTIEYYQEKIDNKVYNFLRLGRTALYYQSLDLKNYGYFNKETKSWIEISDSTSKSNIRKAIKIAKKQQNVELLNLPFLAKKEN